MFPKLSYFAKKKSDLIFYLSEKQTFFSPQVRVIFLQEKAGMQSEVKRE